MCLAIPGKINSIQVDTEGILKIARVSFGGIFQDVSLELLPEAKVNDYVLVHVGVAISIVDEEEARKTFEYLEKIGEIEEEFRNSDAESSAN